MTQEERQKEIFDGLVLMRELIDQNILALTRVYLDLNEEEKLIINKFVEDAKNMEQINKLVKELSFYDETHKIS